MLYKAASLIALQALVTTWVLGFTPRHSLMRHVAFMVICACTFQCISPSLINLQDRALATTISGHVVLLLFHYIDVALINQWSFETHGPGSSRTSATSTQITSPSAGRPSFSKGMDTISWWDRFRFGFSTTITCRFVGTPDQIKSIPPFPIRNPSLVPSRNLFLCWRGLTIALSYLGMNIFYVNRLADLGAEYVTPHHIHIFRRFHEVSSREISMRVFDCFLTLLRIVSTQACLYNVAAFVAVLFHLSEPADWPPFYGSPFEAYTIRRYWSNFWHQSNTHKLKAISNFVVLDVFHMSSSSLATRYMKNFVVFMVSGLMHIPIEYATGVSLAQSGAMPYFCAQIIGVFIEDWTIRLYTFMSSITGMRLPRLVERILGFAWVVLFLSWASPPYTYPKMYNVRMHPVD